MKIKSNLMISAAIAATISAPSTMAAGEGPIKAESLKGFYAQARIGIQYLDDGTDSDTSIESFASRIGYSTESDLDNGLTAYGRLELQVDFEDADGGDNDPFRVRHGYAGLKGSFGDIRIGQGYQTFYNFTVGPVDQPWWFGGSNMIAYTGRTGDALTYKKSFGNFSFGATAYLETDDAEEGTEFAASYDFGPAKIAIGTRELDRFEDPANAFTISGIKSGPFKFAATYQEQGDADSIEAYTKIGNAYVMLGEADGRSATVLGYTLKLGPKALIWFEARKREATDTDEDDLQAIATLRYNIF